MIETRDTWTAKRLLQTAGLRMTGGSFKSAGLRPTTGNNGADVDDEYAAMIYVQSTPGYERVADVVSFVFGHFGDVRKFPYREPGESPYRALLRRGWGIHADEPKGAAKAELQRFIIVLTRRLVKHPFIPPSALARHVIDQTAFGIAETVTADVDEKYRKFVRVS